MSYSRRSLRRWVVSCLLLGSLVLGGFMVAGWADPAAPGAQDRQVTLAVMALLRRDHLLRGHGPTDKEMSQRCLKTYLQMLDPGKMYFYESDIDAFDAHRDTLVDEVQRGDINFAHAVYKTFLERVDQRMKTVDQLLAAPHDFAVDEELVTDKDLVTWPKTEAEAVDRWRKRIKLDLLVLKGEKADKEKEKKEREAAPKGKSGEPEKAATAPNPDDNRTPQERFARRYHSFGKRMHQISGEELLEMYLTAMTTSLDPHTDYMSPGTLENFEIAMRLELEGIGASLQSVDGYTVVKKIIPGGAADKDGRLKLEDKIIAVGEGEDGPLEDVVDMKLNDVVKLIRGKPNTFVRLQVETTNGTERKVYKIARAKIELKDSEAKGKIFDAGRKADGQPYKIGVIDLPSFYMDMSGARRGVAEYKSTTRDVRKILDEFRDKGVDAVVLDLRLNGGGSLTEAISLTGLFLYDGPVVQVKDAEGHITPYPDTDPGISWSGPLVVLTSKFSASASEILAGAIQDYNRGLIVGDHSTHGKGTVQSLLEIGQQLFRVPNAPGMGALKITIQQFYRPLGDSTQKRGVLSDVELPSLTTHLDVGEADLDYPVAFDHIPPQEFKKFDLVTPTIVAQLRKLSEARTAAAEKFQKVVRNIARYKEQKAKKSVTLNEAKFLKERADLTADKEEEKAMEKLINQDSNSIKRDYYLDEVLSITTDYLNSLKQVAKSN